MDRTPDRSSNANNNGVRSPLSSPSTPLRGYFSRRSSTSIKTHDLPYEDGAVGHYSIWGFIYGCIFLSIPVVYIYIAWIVLREISLAFPFFRLHILQHYLPWLASWLLPPLDDDSDTTTTSSDLSLLDCWCILEGCFFLVLKLQIRYLQTRDPLEASLSAAPMMELPDRLQLWQYMMETEKDDPSGFIQGWFLDNDIALEHITKYDVRDFLCWSMFEGRNQEHLTGLETNVLEQFVQELEHRISLQLYGEAQEEEEEECVLVEESDDYHDNEKPLPKEFFQLPASSPPKERSIKEETQNEPLPEHEKWRTTLPKARQVFHFQESTNDQPKTFFSNLYENYKQRYEQYRNMMMENTSDFHPVLQDFRNFMEENAQSMGENAIHTAQSMAENAYHTLVAPGSNMDKQLAALSHATQIQLTEAWNSVKSFHIRERLETAEFLSDQRKRIRQQLKGYRALLGRMREMSSSVPSKQMAKLMRKITDCYEAMERIETSAMKAFTEATGYASKNFSMMGQQKEPQRYAKYSSDPLLGLATYPLGFHCFLLGATEIPLRVMMTNRGFTRLTCGPVAYYYHPGVPQEDPEEEETEKIPIVFIHGIGVGLVVYIPLIDCLLQHGRPIILPEIPYVSGFRPWQSPNSVLPPAVVCSTLTDILATHGYLRGTFAGHSYGSSWCSYMCKYAPNAIAAVCFLDPICFCLHVPRLTKMFVYHRPDPGTISYMVRTDVIVNWTIQRSFPWSWIIIFREQIHVPCSVFLSDKDMLVPAEKVERYLRRKGAPIKDFDSVDRDHFAEGDLNVTVFRGDGHGGWTERSAPNPVIAECLEVLCCKAEKNDTN